jgi:uncharacterized protein (DUF4415 family)
MKKSRQNSGSDLAKIDAHVIQPEEYDEAPEWTDEMFDRADFYIGGKLVRRGRPAGSRKISTTVRFDKDILEAFRKRGKGWQTRMNAALREWLAEH